MPRGTALRAYAAEHEAVQLQQVLQVAERERIDPGGDEAVDVGVPGEQVAEHAVVEGIPVRGPPEQSLRPAQGLLHREDVDPPTDLRLGRRTHPGRLS